MSAQLLREYFYLFSTSPCTIWEGNWVRPLFPNAKKYCTDFQTSFVCFYFLQGVLSRYLSVESDPKRKMGGSNWGGAWAGSKKGLKTLVRGSSQRWEPYPMSSAPLDPTNPFNYCWQMRTICFCRKLFFISKTFFHIILF